MENIPKDITMKIALELPTPDLINFCLINKKNNICSSENKAFWLLLLQRDYPKVFEYYKRNNMILLNPKNTYMRKFVEVSKTIEKFVSEEFNKFNDIQKKEISIRFYNLYKELLPLYSKITLKDIENTAVKYFPKKKKKNMIDYDYKKIGKLMTTLLTKDKMYEMK